MYFITSYLMNIYINANNRTDSTADTPTENYEHTCIVGGIKKRVIFFSTPAVQITVFSYEFILTDKFVYDYCVLAVTWNGREIDRKKNI